MISSSPTRCFIALDPEGRKGWVEPSFLGLARPSNVVSSSINIDIARRSRCGTCGVGGAGGDGATGGEATLGRKGNVEPSTGLARLSSVVPLSTGIDAEFGMTDPAVEPKPLTAAAEGRSACGGGGACGAKGKAPGGLDGDGGRKGKCEGWAGCSGSNGIVVNSSTFIDMRASA